MVALSSNPLASGTRLVGGKLANMAWGLLFLLILVAGFGV